MGDHEDREEVGEDVKAAQNHHERGDDPHELSEVLERGVVVVRELVLSARVGNADISHL